ncbi:MAG: isochorismatase family protein [Verrucomicrobia bacterium]|nr:isochorismatase family protein [Verrucomicrobiota bacterium]
MCKSFPLRSLALRILHPTLWGQRRCSIAPSETALILVDIQNDFLPGGALPAPQGDRIAPFVAQLISRFEHVIATKDWHPPGHSSFALFGSHCIQGSWGAEHPPWLDQRKIERTILKGTDPHQDSFSGFGGGELARVLKEWVVKRVMICGLVTDICVKETALEARRLGFETGVVRDACAPLQEEKEAIAEMEAAGVNIYTTEEIVT